MSGAESWVSGSEGVRDEVAAVVARTFLCSEGARLQTDDVYRTSNVKSVVQKHVFPSTWRSGVLPKTAMPAWYPAMQPHMTRIRVRERRSVTVLR